MNYRDRAYLLSFPLPLLTMYGLVYCFFNDNPSLKMRLVYLCFVVGITLMWMGLIGSFSKEEIG